MKTLEEIKNDLIGVSCEINDLDNCIIEIFGDYEFEGETEVIISKQHTSAIAAYINHIDAPIIAMKYDLISAENYILITEVI